MQINKSIEQSTLSIAITWLLSGLTINVHVPNKILKVHWPWIPEK